jgi:hypothetical protein
MQDKSSAEMAVFPAEAPPCLPSTPSNSTDAAEYQNRTYPLPRGSKRQANSMSFIKLLTPMQIDTAPDLLATCAANAGGECGASNFGVRVKLSLP